MVSSDVQTKVLRRKTTPEEYRVYRAGLEWDLADPIVIEKRGDLKSEYRWHERMEPYHHQIRNLITFCRRLPVTLIADDVGLGKTISAGLIVSELISRSRLSRILVVCPKLIGPQWQEELLTKFDISSEIAAGRALMSAQPEGIGAVITTYNSARLYLRSIPKDRFQMLILDEAHKLRNLYGTPDPPQVATCFRDALEERRFRFVLMLTATPIQNRLWDLYSLVDLLTVARGHKNPFGSEIMFASKFIADSRDHARQLKREARDEFRSIVYGYMSRVRRADAGLYFPEREVQTHRVEPTTAELELIETVARPIEKLNRLAQISILQALTSSPKALSTQLNNMAAKGTVPEQLAASVRAIVDQMPASAKLQGLFRLIDELERENPDGWRLVVFTGRIETQASIQLFLEEHGLKVGTINGMSGQRNQVTIARFRRNPPGYHVIVSTEAGSEGVNLQSANVVVNYDLPWNPMIVEQRIGRVQRLASEHARVGVFNIILSGTFEEYIVGRLMEKLQMASQAIGDMEALLSGISEEDENVGFDERIRRLVIASLQGKDVEAATRLEEQSIANAKNTLEREKASIDAMLGGMDGTEYVGPRAPTLPASVRSMEPSDFTLAALRSLGARITPLPPDMHLVEENGRRQRICFEEGTGERSTLYSPGTAAFLHLVDRITATGIFDVNDLDQNPDKTSEELVRRWTAGFGATFQGLAIDEVHRYFEGTALVRVRATVAHDSYERLVEVSCSPAHHHAVVTRNGLGPLPNILEDPTVFGIDLGKIAEVAELDEAIAEFRRFYLERREQEMRAAGGDERKRRKLEDEFTPRLERTLVGLEGKLYRRLTVKAQYRFDAEPEYSTALTVTPHTGELTDSPKMGQCSLSGRTVPMTCLGQCQIGGVTALQHLLARSEVSSRLALPEHTVRCRLSGKLVLRDEAELSAVSGRVVASSLLRTSAVSGKRAEPEHFGVCQFTDAEVLNTELATSEVSGKRYRADERVRSSISGKAGHRREFVICHETRQPLTRSEAEQCEVTGEYVRPGVLEPCAITQKRVLPSELLRCASTGKRALRKFFVVSNLSGAHVLESVAVRSARGESCTPIESKPCLWSGRRFHPEDLRACGLTGLPIHFVFAKEGKRLRLQPLAELLDGVKRSADESHLWDAVAARAEEAIERGRCRVETADLSPDGQHLAVCAEVRTLLGLRRHKAGFVFCIGDNSIVGRVALGRRTSGGWVEARS